ncbi:hypothetical protein VTL71DRAFT_8736 [Oculimacula yallundae]|uniref:Uncharacterized protein n=1 Tax=Oculimacula yallundae TaxID=86028 RepID=A0ABR4D0P4_9HELO
MSSRSSSEESSGSRDPDYLPDERVFASEQSLDLPVKRSQDLRPDVSLQNLDQGGRTYLNANPATPGPINKRHYLFSLPPNGYTVSWLNHHKFGNKVVPNDPESIVPFTDRAEFQLAMLICTRGVPATGFVRIKQCEAVPLVSPPALGPPLNAAPSFSASYASPSAPTGPPPKRKYHVVKDEPCQETPRQRTIMRRPLHLKPPRNSSFSVAIPVLPMIDLQASQAAGTINQPLKIESSPEPSTVESDFGEEDILQYVPGKVASSYGRIVERRVSPKETKTEGQYSPSDEDTSTAEQYIEEVFSNCHDRDTIPVYTSTVQNLTTEMGASNHRISKATTNSNNTFRSAAILDATSNRSVDEPRSLAAQTDGETFSPQHLASVKNVGTMPAGGGVRTEIDVRGVKLKSSSPTLSLTTLSPRSHITTSSTKHITQTMTQPRPVDPANRACQSRAPAQSVRDIPTAQPKRPGISPKQVTLPTQTAKSDYKKLLLETQRRARKERRLRTRVLHEKLAKLQKKSEEFYKEQQRKTDKYLQELKQLADAEDVEGEDEKEEDYDEEDLYSAN